MKYIAFLALFSQATFAAEFYKLQIDWNSNKLEETVVLQCDDSYYSGVELEVAGDYTFSNGQNGVASYMKYKDCGADWKIMKKDAIEKNGQPYTRVRLKGASDCQLEVIQRTKRPGKPQRFTVDIGESC